ncbi:PAS domain S-box-containing protein [bacterium A37T11]|nr:PAS domain S-box-containing protein [bacterium A37T11]
MGIENQRFTNLRVDFLTNAAMQSILMEMPLAMYACDVNGIIKFYNAEAATLWQMHPTIGEDTWRAVWKLYRQDFQALLSEEFPIFRTLKLQVRHSREELLAERADGSIRHLIIYSYPIFDENNLFNGAYELIYDVTDQKKARTHHQIISSVIESAEDAVILKDLQGLVIGWNNGAIKLLGYISPEIIGQHISQIIPTDRQKEDEQIMELIKRGERIRHYETILKHKSGRWIPISLTISPIRDENGKIIGVSKIAREITQEVAVRKMLELYNKKLKQENQYKDQFLSLASHELKTPLTSAKAYIQLILHNANKHRKYYTFATKALLSLGKLENLINGLLDVSRIKIGKMTYTMAEINVRDFVENTVEDVRQFTEVSRIQITQLDDSRVMGDKLKLEQVLINLLNNAIKYSPDGEVVQVAVKKIQNKVVISVSDHGIGIPPQSINLLFDRYYRVNHTADNFPGLGLGLFIAAEILKKHDGTYWVESTLGEGSTFYFSLPLS